MSVCFGRFFWFVPPAKLLAFCCFNKPERSVQADLFLCEKNDFVKHFSWNAYMKHFLWNKFEYSGDGIFWEIGKTASGWRTEMHAWMVNGWGSVFMSTSVLLPLRKPGVKNESLCLCFRLCWKELIRLITCLFDWLLFLFGSIGCFIKQYPLLILERVFRISLKWSAGEFIFQAKPPVLRLT